MYAGEVVGAGGAGGVLSGIPFEPAVLLMSEATGPLLQWMLPGSSGQVDINGITGAAAAAAPVVAADGADWKVTLPTGIAPDGDTVSVLCVGLPKAGGSL
jgi:hypothetical protein